MKVYIAGAISNNPNYKEQFKRAEERLKERGFEVYNPALNQGYTYRELINIGLYELMHCDAIYLLKGYEESTGATLEHDYARTVGLIILKEEYEDETPEESLLRIFESNKELGNDFIVKNEDVDILCKALKTRIKVKQYGSSQEGKNERFN